MDFHGMLAKPIQVMKEILDLEPELESPSLASQLVVIKHQLHEVQSRLNESYRISREKDAVIAKLLEAAVTKTPKSSVAATTARSEEKPVRMRESSAGSAETVKLPAVSCYQAAVELARTQGPDSEAKSAASSAQAAEDRVSPARQGKRTKARATGVASTRKTGKTGSATRKKTTQATKTTRKAGTGKTTGKAEAKATARSRRSSCAEKS
jgi:hypothetical protein